MRSVALVSLIGVFSALLVIAASIHLGQSGTVEDRGGIPPTVTEEEALSRAVEWANRLGIDAEGWQVRRGARASGHYYYVASVSGSATGIETTGTRHTALPMPGGILVHANHYQDAGLLELSRSEPGENSLTREATLDGYLRERVGRLTVDDLIAGLRLSDGEHPICRAPVDDSAGATTCAAAVICPQLRKIWVAPGNPGSTDFTEVTV